MMHDVDCGITQSRFRQKQMCQFNKCHASEWSGRLLASTTRVTRGSTKRCRRRWDDRTFILRISAALILFVSCINDRHFKSMAWAAAENSEVSKAHLPGKISADNRPRMLGRAVPARKRAFARTSRTANNFWWGSSAEPIVDDDDGWGSGLLNSSKASKSSSKGGKSGKAKQIIPMPPQPVQQIIIYIPSPTKKPITDRPTISPKPTAPPTASPTRRPSMSPTGSPSFVTSTSPSLFRTDFPSGRPTFHSSDHPSDQPSGNPSFSPFIQLSEEPSVSPSRIPSLKPSSALTNIPTSKPEAFPSLTIAPSAVGLKSFVPTFLDTPTPISSKTNKPVDTAKPTKEAKTAKPSPSGSVPPTGTNLVNTTSPSANNSSNIPTVISSLAPTSATTPQGTTSTQMPNVVPTVMPMVMSTVLPTVATTTDSPFAASTPPTVTPSSIASVSSTSVSNFPTSTTDSIVDERQDLEMFLYGIDMLTSSRTTSYEEETKKYIEDFYNTDIDPGSLLSTLKDSVYNVSAVVKVTDWTQPANPSLTGNRRKLANETAEDKAKVIVLDVTEPCTGESPLMVTFSLTLQYLVDDPKLRQSELIIAFPFRTVDFRTTYIEDYLQSGGEFNGLYCTSRIVFPGGRTPVPSYFFTPAPSSPDVTISPSSTPTITATTSVPTSGSTAVPSGVSDKPTTDTIVDERKDLQMFLYGIDLLTPSRTKSYEVETKNYIEDFYNADNASGSLHSKLKGSVYGVSAAVKVTDWSQPADLSPSGNRRIFPIRKIQQPNVTAEEKAKVIVLDVTEPCTGESPLIVTFSLKLQYRVDDPKLSQSDLVISFPFGTVDFRTTYIREYLQSGGEFNGLYCTSQIVFPGGKTPTPSNLITGAPSSIGVSGTPTVSLSFLPTTEGTAVPTSVNSGTGTPSIVDGTIVPTSVVSILPTTPSNGSIVPTLSGSLTPTLISPSFTPSTLNGTLFPTLANTTDSGSVVPTFTPSVLSASSAPSMVNASTPPSVLNASAAPSLLNTSIAPSVVNASFAPSVVNASTAPSVVNASTAPSLVNASTAPSLVNASTAPSLVNASIAPTVVNASIAPSITTENATAIPTPSPSAINASTAPSVLNASFVPTSNFNETSLVPTISLNGTAPPSARNDSSSSVPTASNITESMAPTATLPPWEMRMYGMTDLTEPGQVLYNQRTALYMEDFYNGSSSEGIRGQISGMTAIVQVLGQIPPSPIRASSNTRTSKIVIHHGKRQHTVNHSSNQGSFVLNDKGDSFGRGGGRFLQNNDCSGSFLTLRLKINITYTTLNSALTPDEVLKEPFSTAEYRDNYLNNYLDNGPEGGRVFGDLTCTSEILETSPRSKGPTPVPVVSSATPSIASGGNESLSPTIAVLSGNASYAPSLLNASIAPSVLNPSAGSTSNSTDDETSMVPTLSSNMTASPSVGNTTNISPTPSNITESIAPSSSSAGNLTTPSPVITGASTIPTLISNITTPPPVNRDTDDIFGGMLKSTRSSPAYDRKCSNVDIDTRMNAEEIEIKFVYGVETKTHKQYFIDDMENVILDFLTTSVLRCAEDDLEPTIQPRMTNGVFNFGVLRIRYPTNGEITSTTKKCIATSSAAKGCLVLSTKLLITTTHSPVSEVHTGILKVLQDAFTTGTFAESVSDVVLATYLGPDVNTLYASALATETLADNNSSEGNIVIAIMFSVTIVLAAAIWVCISSPLTRREVMDKIRSATTRRKRYQSLSGGNNHEQQQQHQDDEEEEVVESGNLAVYRDSDCDADSQYSHHTRNLLQ
eukprot:CCRYP_016705-RA/>CCRYP_016705-RA protein AED:0.19 eAED:0.19 QI:249/0.5/0.33/0.66/1/1/3/0/1773